MRSFLIIALWFTSSCITTREPDPPAVDAPIAIISSPREAAAHAAQLANEECERRHGQRPFGPRLWVAEAADGRWTWGRIDPAGPGGYSAIVSFDLDGGRPEVRIFVASDQPSLRGDVFLDDE